MKWDWFDYFYASITALMVIAFVGFVYEACQSYTVTCVDAQGREIFHHGNARISTYKTSPHVEYSEGMYVIPGGATCTER